MVAATVVSMETWHDMQISTKNMQYNMLLIIYSDQTIYFRQHIKYHK